MSRTIGWFAHIPLPRPLSTFTVKTFAKCYNIDTRLAVEPIDSFPSVGKFFTRDMKPELRPMEEGIVCPVDGTLRSMQKITDGTLIQVKGVAFSIADLLSSADEARLFDSGVAWNFYLSPQDAHHIHAPVDGTVRLSRHVPGNLFPVNDWALKNVPGLFVRNERIVSLIDSEWGPIAVVMVGAANVGAISLGYSDIKAWRRRRAVTTEVHSPAVQIAKGSKLGTFHLGSSVIVLASSAVTSRVQEISELTKVVYGGALLAS